MSDQPKIEKTKHKEPLAVEKIGLKVKRQKPAEHVASILKKVSFLQVQNGGQNVTATHIESLDLQKKPYSYWQTTFTPSEIQLEWSIPHGQQAFRRKIEVSKNVFQLLALLEAAYPVSSTALRPLVLDTIETALTQSNKTQNQLEHENDAQNRKIQFLLKEKEYFDKTLARLNTEISHLAQENEKTKAELARYSRLTDSSLKTKIMDHVGQHDEIDLQTFSNQLELPVSRVEIALEELVKQGFLQPVK